MNLNSAIAGNYSREGGEVFGMLNSKFNDAKKRIRVMYSFTDNTETHIKFVMAQFDSDENYKNFAIGVRYKILACGCITYTYNNCGLALAYALGSSELSAELLVELCSRMHVGGIVYTLTNEQPALKASLEKAGFVSSGCAIRNPNTHRMIDVLTYDYKISVCHGY